MEIQITDAELSQLFRHSGGWAQGMIARHLTHLHADKPTTRGRPKVVQSNSEEKLIQFCLSQQSQKSFVTIQNAIDFMEDNHVQVDRF
jgi:hypothetical protein